MSCGAISPSVDVVPPRSLQSRGCARRAGPSGSRVAATNSCSMPPSFPSSEVCPSRTRIARARAPLDTGRTLCEVDGVHEGVFSPSSLSGAAPTSLLKEPTALALASASQARSCVRCAAPAGSQEVAGDHPRPPRRVRRRAPGVDGPRRASSIGGHVDPARLRLGCSARAPSVAEHAFQMRTVLHATAAYCT